MTGAGSTPRTAAELWRDQNARIGALQSARRTSIGRGVRSGPTALRTEITPKYWDFWLDTDDGHMYVGSKSGTWRQYSGSTAAAAAAWDTINGTGTAALAGRTVNITIPTVLETTETLLFQAGSVGSGFGFLSGVSVTRNPTNTTLTVRFMQIMSTATQSFSVNWEIIPL
jgi:hypothetical protein